MITYDILNIPSEHELRALFDSVGWAQMLTDAELQLAIDKSSHLVTAWDDTELVGLIRSMDDGIYSANIDLLLVHTDYQNKGIGTTLITKLLEQMSNIKCISTSPNESKNFGLYQRCGFKLVDGSGLLQLENVIYTKSNEGESKTGIAWNV